MCAECGHLKGHATMCPNNPALADDDPIMKRCPICEREFDEEEMDYAVCDECLEKNITRKSAIEIGEKHKVSYEINGYLAYEFDESEVRDILIAAMLENIPYKSHYYGYVHDDRGGLADWLVEQKKGGG